MAYTCHAECVPSAAYVPAVSPTTSSEQLDLNPVKSERSHVPPLDAMGWVQLSELRKATSPFEKNTFIRSDAVTGFAAANSQDRFFWSATAVRRLLLAVEKALPNEHAARFSSEHPGEFGGSTSLNARWFASVGESFVVVTHRSVLPLLVSNRIR